MDPDMDKGYMGSNMKQNFHVDLIVYFQIPFVPLLPALIMLFNICMMIKLSPYTWIRLAIWLTIGQCNVAYHLFFFLHI